MPTARLKDQTRRRLKARLGAVGRRRAKHAAAEKRLREDTERALREAQGVIPIEEAARLAGVARATAYQSYLGGRNGKADRSGKSRGRKSKRAGARSKSPR